MSMELHTSFPRGFLSSASLLLLLMNLSEHVSAASYLRNETDRLALLEFKRQISDDPHRVLNSWNDSLHHCQWQGITCGVRHQRVTALTLRDKNLLGLISPYIGNLSFLKSVELGGNRFHGKIPQEVGFLFRLKALNLTSNTFTGEIPVNLSQCLDLRAIDVNGNGLEGKIPTELSSLKKLLVLRLRTNNLTGEVHPFLGNLSSIKMLSLAFNNLEGGLPQEIGLLTNLFFFAVGANKLTGTFPTSIFNISSIAFLSLIDNFFYGKLPADIGLKLTNLLDFSVYGNQFHGVIPMSITNASNLEFLDLGENKFEGQVPTNLGDLPNLRWFSIEANFLGSNSAGDLSFIASLSNCSNLHVLAFAENDFGGELPNNIANLSFQLRIVYMGVNKLSGTIPIGLGRYIKLCALGLEWNFFSGTIPSDFGEFQQLQRLSLGVNQLSGQIPVNLCNITLLYDLNLRVNSFVGKIPQCFGNSQSLRIFDISVNNISGFIPPNIFSMHFSGLVLDLSYNSLNGHVPLEVGKLKDMNVFNISYNKFTGEIPETLGDCLSLENLDMQGNYFFGSIPPKLALLNGIQHLDLSQNNLSGQIPKDLERLTVLKYLNLSFNKLEGEIPTNGVFGNASQIMLAGNNKLCGGIPELYLPSCINHKKKNGKPMVIILVPMLVTVILISAILSSYCVVYQKRKKGRGSSSMSLDLNKFLRISFQELHRATAGFSQENLIGSGSFGFVYKGRLHQHGDRIVAIKVLNLQKNGASSSFKAECRTLRNIRHRNLVAILTYCSSIDFRGNDFKALVYEYMENGSLDMWLHPEKGKEATESRNLNLLQRLNIAIDVASALHYLHSFCEAVIVHCDLKPSNILLDCHFNAHVGDFGLARLLQKTFTSSSEQGTSSSIAIKGSIGYAAPEYGIGSEPSIEGDVYSYGILLLEMFTGRRPTDDIFVEDFDLHNYVEMNLAETEMKIADPLLLSGENTRNLQEYVVSMFKIGLKCSAKSPNDRMRMDEVVRELHFIKDALLSETIN